MRLSLPLRVDSAAGGGGFSLSAAGTATEGDNVSLQAFNAPAGTTSVEFFDGVSSISTDNSGPPWTATLTSITAGTHTLSAVAAPSSATAYATCVAAASSTNTVNVIQVDTATFVLQVDTGTQVVQVGV